MEFCHGRASKAGWARSVRLRNVHARRVGSARGFGGYRPQGAAMSVDANWWERFFEGLPVRLCLEALSQEHTESEAESIARWLSVQPGADLLDVPCGGGRLSLALAE